MIYGPGDIRLVDKAIPQPGPGEVLVKVKYCGICGSDLHAYESGFFPPGVTIGHEFSGFVATAGPTSENWSAGDPVTGNNNTPCWKCPLCLQGKDNLCPNMRRLGIAEDGALAEYVVIPSISLQHLPEGVSMQEAALSEPLSVALHAVNKSDGITDVKALIIGAGTIGLLILTLLRLRGLRDIAIIEPEPGRAAASAALGAAVVIDPFADSPAAEVEKFFGCNEPRLVFECAGLPQTISEACSYAATGGTVIMLGICHQPVEINFLGPVTREINIIPAFSKKAVEFREAVELITHSKLDLAPIISRTIPLANLEEGLKPSADNGIKILVTP